VHRILSECIGTRGLVLKVGSPVRFAGVGGPVEELHSQRRLVIGDVQVGEPRERGQRERLRRGRLGEVIRWRAVGRRSCGRSRSGWPRHAGVVVVVAVAAGTAAVGRTALVA
jgi:hypothetical protein